MNAPLHLYALTRQLVACPFHEPALADARTPPYRALGDYAAMHALVREEAPAPILVGYGQYYRVLALLAEQARALQLDAPLLLEVTRPLGVPLPAGLLAPDVLIADHIDTELAFWTLHAQRGVLSARLRIRREPHEYGDNHLHLALASRVHAADPLPVLAAALGRPGAWRPATAPVARHCAPQPSHTHE